MTLLEANLQNADAAFWKREEGYHGLGKPNLQLHAIESRHRALAPVKHSITLLGTDQAAVMHSSQPRACRIEEQEVRCGTNRRM